MSNVKIVLNSPGINAMLHSDMIKAVLMEHAQAAASRAGDGYEASSFEMPSRSVVRISAETREAQIDNSANNTLLKALYGG